MAGSGWGLLGAIEGKGTEGGCRSRSEGSGCELPPPPGGFPTCQPVCHDGVCVGGCHGGGDPRLCSPALGLGAGQSAQNLGFLCFPWVAPEPMPTASSGSPDPGTQQEVPSPSPGGSPQVIPQGGPRRPRRESVGSAVRLGWSRTWKNV